MNSDYGRLVERTELDTLEEQKLSIVIDKFKTIADPNKLGRISTYEYVIDTGDALPIKQNPYPCSPIIQQKYYNQLDQLLALDVVEPSKSPWCSPTVLVKKANGSDRLCIDSRKLNKVTKKDSYPLPRVSHILDRLGKTIIMSSIDLKYAFHQIPLSPNSKEKTAFCIPGRGLFQYKVLPFGLNNAAQCLQRLMDRLFGHTLSVESKIFVYLDDLIVVSESFEEHICLLDQVFETLKEANLTISFEKCQFCRSELKYLGFVIDKNGLRTDPNKVEIILNFPRPKTCTELKRFIGLISWYRRFVKNFAIIAAPIHELTKGKRKNQPLVWTEQAHAAFISLKDSLTEAPVMATPDFSKKFKIQCDASNTGIGAVLTQGEGDEERPIAFDGRKFRGAEINYDTTQKECLAVVFAVEKFRPYVEGYEFEVYTDHSALTWLFNKQDLKGRLARWVLRLQEYNFKIFFRKGSLNVVPDALSRIEVLTTSSSTFEIEETDTWYIKMLSKVALNPVRFKNWKIDEGKLYLKLNLSNKVVEDRWKTVVPESARYNILSECHDDARSAHLGIAKTKNRIIQKYYWPGLAIDVEYYVKNCETCKKCKNRNSQPQGLMGQYKEANRPWQMISLDLMGPFPSSSNQNTMLLVICDWFTKFPILVPMRRATGKKVSDILEKQVFLTYNVPEIVIADNGPQFISTEFKNLISKYGIQKLWYNSRYHPQNNFTERTNKTIGSAIRSYIEDNHRHWDKYIAEITLAFRTAVHEITGYSPFFLNFGREYISSPTEYKLFDPQPENTTIENLDKRSNFLENFKLVYKDIEMRIKKAYEKNKKYYDKKRKIIEFAVGDKVYKKNYVLSDASKYFSAKLAPKYIPVVIKNKISKLIYDVVDKDGKSLGRWHIKDLYK